MPCFGLLETGFLEIVRNPWLKNAFRKPIQLEFASTIGEVETLGLMIRVLDS